MFAFTIIMIVIYSVLDLLVLIGVLISMFINHDDEGTVLSGLIILSIVSLTLIYAISVCSSMF